MSANKENDSAASRLDEQTEKEEDLVNKDIPNLYPTFTELLTGKKADENTPKLPPNPSFWTVIK